jgi:hypothetical protein
MEIQAKVEERLQLLYIIPRITLPQKREGGPLGAY